MKALLFPSLTIVALGLASCGKPAGGPPMQMPPMAVTIAHPVKQKVTEWDEYTGRLDAVESVSLYSQVTGYLQSVHFKDGTEVKKGDLLFQIDPRPFQAVLDQATAQKDRAQVQLTLAKSDHERGTKLLEGKAISAEDFDKRTQTVRDAEASLRLAQATVDAAQLNLEYTQIKAPISGRIGRRLIDVGNLVVGGPMGATLMGSIVSLDPMYCYIDTDELSVLRYQKINNRGGIEGAKENEIPVEMALADEEGFPHKGVVDFVDNRLNPNTGTIQSRATFPNPKPERGLRLLQPGYFTRVRVPGAGQKDELLIDEKAIGADQAQKIVYVVGKDNIVMPRPVVVGPAINGKRIIREGLTEEDRVVINGMARLMRPGMPVNPMTEEEAKKAQQGPPPGPAAPKETAQAETAKK